MGRGWKLHSEPCVCVHGEATNHQITKLMQMSIQQKLVSFRVDKSEGYSTIL